MSTKQLFLFDEKSDQLESQVMNEVSGIVPYSLVSLNVKENFGVYDIPFLGCDFTTVYPIVVSVIPKENTLFSYFGTDAAIMCEIICSAICHQINWDFLRASVYAYTKGNPEWLKPYNLAVIGSKQLDDMLGTYHKKDNIKAAERAEIVSAVGKWADQYREIREVFLDGQNVLRPQEQVCDSLQKCAAFSSDPEGKKMNLLLQKLNVIPELNGIDCYSKPAIDYHLLRLYLRRGLLYARTKYAVEYISNPGIERKESTVAAVRELCSELLRQISLFTGLSISTINLIEWHVARSVCQREHPDCDLKGDEALWLKPIFNECPFRHTCMACNYSNENLKFVKEPSYTGTSY